MAQKNLLLGKAFEIQENKERAVESYKQALKFNCECFEAFDCLIKNNLLMEEEKHELISSLLFGPKQLWLKDYYLSKINKELMIGSKAEGKVKLNVSELDNIQIQIQFSSENYGVSPIRINNLFESDHQGESLRAPQTGNKAIILNSP